MRERRRKKGNINRHKEVKGKDKISLEEKQYEQILQNIETMVFVNTVSWDIQLPTVFLL